MPSITLYYMDSNMALGVDMHVHVRIDMIQVSENVFIFFHDILCPLIFYEKRK